MLFQDEASFYRQPGQSQLWSGRGRRQSKIYLGHHSNKHPLRVVGFLDALSGQVISFSFPRVTAKRLAGCIRELQKSYPLAERVYLVWDNWPVHLHRTVVEAVEEDSRLRVLPFPTYSPWLNPIEKLWRLLHQELTHAHPWPEDFKLFAQIIMARLALFRFGSVELLHYCGLAP